MVIAAVLVTTLGALPGQPVLAVDFSGEVPGLQVHGGVVADGALHLEDGAWAEVPVPEAARESRGLRLSARFRLDKLAGGQVPAMIFGRAALYVLSDGYPLGLYWTGENHSGLKGTVRLEPGRWYEMALDYRQGGFLSLYLDGEPVGRRLAQASLRPGEERLVMGRWQWQEEGEWRYSPLAGDVAWVKVEQPAGPTLAELDPPLRLIKHVSWGDIILQGEATSRRAIRELLEEIAADGLQKVHWRLSSAVINEYHRRAPEETWAPGIRTYYGLVDAIWAEFDPIAAACRDCRELGRKVYGWLTIFDEGAPPSVLYAGSTPFPWQSRFTIEHPEYLVRDRDGEPQWGVLEYAYPEARRYMVAQILDYASRYDLDGIFISTRSHSPPAQDGDRFGFNEPILAAYRERYGTDPLGQGLDLEAWRRLRGEQVTKLLRELRAALPASKRLCIGIPRGDWFGPPYGNMAIDWRTWLREGLVDELVIGEISGKGLYPRITEYRGYVFDQEARVGLRPLLEDVEEVFGPACREAGVELYVQGTDDAPAFWKHLEQGDLGLRM